MSSDQQQEHSYGWFVLLDSASGEPYKGASVTKVAVSSSADVADFRDAVKAKHSNKLSSFDACQLSVYKNKSAFDKRNLAEGQGKEDPMDPTECLGLLGSIEDMLVVAVPSSISSSQSTAASFSFPPGKQPHPKRLERWIKLNEVLERNAKRSKTNDSTENSDLTGNQVESVYKEPHPKRKERWIKLNEILERNAQQSEHNDPTANSDLTWNQCKSIFNPTHYDQKRREMDEDQLSFLANYLSMTSKCFTCMSTRKDATRLHFIGPILFCVCSLLLGGDVDIVVEEDLVGTFVKAQGHFEFMLRRKNKAVCIVLAKKEDFEQGMVQALVGCEVAAEVGGLDDVYGIVTNYFQWNFLHSCDDKVEMEECSLATTGKGPGRDSLKKIPEKIYAMLSD